jgi:hypothetical protein
VTPTKQQTFAQALREWLHRDETGRNAERVAVFVIEKATSGHFAYFKLVIELVDGKLRQTAEDKMTFETDYVLIGGNEGLDSERPTEVVKAA